jgi:PPP family 3-phenylpropionic acid transporter
VKPPSVVRLAVFYVLFFMSVGVTLPFMPQYLHSLGLSASEVGVLNGVSPALAMLVPPWWGQLADRSGRPGLVLLAINLGGLLGYVALFFATSFLGALASIALAALFYSAMTPVLDTLALHHVRAVGGSYARVRSFGSIGFVVTSLTFGFVVDRIDRAVVGTAVVLMIASAIWCALTLARVPPVHHEGPKPSARAAIDLLGQKDIALFLLAAGLHWLACAPYHGSLSLHLTALKHPPSVVSLTASVAVMSEVLVLLVWPRIGGRLKPTTWLLVSFGVSALRWLAIASVDSAWALVATSALHGLTFGAFYVSAVQYMADHVPDSLRATGQTLFASATFGLSGMIGFVASGRLYDALGGHAMFAIAAGVEALPAIAVVMLSRTQGTRTPRPA